MEAKLYNGYYLNELQTRFILDEKTLKRFRVVKDICDQKDVLMEDVLASESISSLIGVFKTTEINDHFRSAIEEACVENQKQNQYKKKFDMLCCGAGL